VSFVWLAIVTDIHCLIIGTVINCEAVGTELDSRSKGKCELFEEEWGIVCNANANPCLENCSMKSCGTPVLRIVPQRAVNGACQLVVVQRISYVDEGGGDTTITKWTVKICNCFL
jgi:hypothetical protein